MFTKKQLVVMIVCSMLVISLSFITAMGQESSEKESPITYTFYGYLKLDMAYDTSSTDVGNFARWVNSEELILRQINRGLVSNSQVRILKK